MQYKAACTAMDIKLRRYQALYCGTSLFDQWQCPLF
ncbi:Uncharacterised protein [Stenotrophomonas maltophilia]|nr:Uncharacterised protein [Stenotrophomonas maltophilia]